MSDELANLTLEEAHQEAMNRFPGSDTDEMIGGQRIAFLSEVVIAKMQKYADLAKQGPLEDPEAEHTVLLTVHQMIEDASRITYVLHQALHV